METRPLQRSTEYYGLGQSGYTAGRVGDPALDLELEGRNAAYPRSIDEEHAVELSEDERFVGLGATPWVPEREPTSQEGR